MSLQQIEMAPTADPIAVVGDYLLSGASDLAQQLCLLSNDYLIVELQRYLLAKGANLLLPKITTLKNYMQEISALDVAQLSQEDCQLALAKIVAAHPSLYGSEQPWHLAANLLQLFNEMDAQNLNADMDYAEFLNKIASAEHDFAQLGKNASLVYTLWHAWHAELREHNCADAQTLFKMQLQQQQQQSAFSKIINLQGLNPLASEQHWLATVAQHCEVVQFEFASFDFAKLPRPSLDCFAAKNFEQLAQGIAELAATAAKLRARTLIIGADRKLSRRIQALLSNRNISVADKSGWALSTTLVGALLHNWLQCIESDFAAQQFLVFLKANSNNFNCGANNSLDLIAQFEKLLLKHKLNGDLNAYIKLLTTYAGNCAPTDAALADYNQLLQILNCCAQAAAPLQQLLAGNLASLFTYLQQLTQSLQQLAIVDFLIADSAGEVLWQALQQAMESSAHKPILSKINWQQFRNWLVQFLESRYFRLPAGAAHISLLTLEQANFLSADFCIICNADAEHLPPAPAASPFFNQATRMQLNLQSVYDFQHSRKQLLARILARSPRAAVAWQSHNQDGQLSFSPWLLDWQIMGMQIVELPQLNNLLIKNLQQQLAPENAYVNAVEAQFADLLAARLSVSAHQRLISNPFDFYVTDILKLRAIENIENLIDAREYGILVHKVLQALHEQVGSLPAPPAPSKWQQSNKAELLQHATTIANMLFAKYINNNLQNSIWLQRLLQSLPLFIDWNIGRFADWQICALEQQVEIQLAANLILTGQIDRVERNGSGELALIDYKTGEPPNVASILSGENVQLSSYAIDRELEQLCYVRIDKLKKQTLLSGEDIASISAAVKQRLIDLHAKLQTGVRLQSYCAQIKQSCRHPGICRCDVSCA